jgi:hypothetical protein
MSTNTTQLLQYRLIAVKHILNAPSTDDNIHV